MSKVKTAYGTWTRPLPTNKYEGRDVNDPRVAFRTIFEIDTRDSDKDKCLAMYGELLDPIQGMPEMMQGCAADMLGVRQDDVRACKMIARRTLRAKVEEAGRDLKRAKDTLEVGEMNPTPESEDDGTAAELSPEEEAERKERPPKPTFAEPPRGTPARRKKELKAEFDAQVARWERMYKDESEDEKHDHRPRGPRTPAPRPPPARRTPAIKHKVPYALVELRTANRELCIRLAANNFTDSELSEANRTARSSMG